MNDYRKEASEIATETRWTFFRFLPIFAMVIIVLFTIGFGLKSLGIIGSTIVERKVFEESYQRSEAIKSQIATDEAVLEEISVQLSNPNLNESIRYNLMAQQAAARVRISTAKRKQK